VWTSDLGPRTSARGYARVVQALLVVCLVAASARAQPLPEDFRRRDAGYVGKAIPLLEIDNCPEPPALAADKLLQIGAEHFDRGELLYVQGDYRGAVDELVAAYCIRPFYSILKDIGQAYERELEYEKAIAYFERFVLAVPRDAHRAATCDPDPQDEKKNVGARIQVLQKLRAKIRVETDPPGARVTLGNDAGIAGSMSAGRELEVDGGHYVMTIEQAGYHSRTREIDVEIGKPYTFFERLDPVKGRLHVRIVPGDARVYLDRRAVGAGAYDGELEARTYQLVAEAPGRQSITRSVDVVPDRDTSVSFELPPAQQEGRAELLVYGALASAGAASTFAADSVSIGPDAIFGAAGLVAGGLVLYFALPEHVAEGTSSLAITSSVVGGAVALGAEALANPSGKDVPLPLVGVGLLVGGGVGYYAGNRFHVSPGDAAIINSGVVWGGVAAGLLAVSFTSTLSVSAQRQLGGGIALSGVAFGSVGGVLLQRYFTISRVHAALIDAGGLVGGLAGLAALQVYIRAGNLVTTNDERTANFALAGMVGGLVAAGVLTRHLDEPDVAVSPAFGAATAANGRTLPTLGVSGTF
jgi:hypothetical protein